ncbi:MAG TPA: NUDIX hydrolase [Candidatus Chromulinivoraceae bacterium]|nr:NUDIX hydrolase [Candidatus Chromulinivoraceae bacterium]
MISPKEQLFHVGVKALVHDGQGNLLLLHITRKNGEKYWDLPGGRIDNGETAEAALDRELLEETGLTGLVVQKHLGIFMTDITIPLSESQHANLLFSVYLYSTTPSSQTTMNTESNMTIRWTSFDEALDDRIGYFPSDLLRVIRSELEQLRATA